jgi:cytochrome c oxidase cbb3-type subunit 3
MNRATNIFLAVSAGALIAGLAHVAAQAPAPAPGGRGAAKQTAAPARGGGGGGGAYPARPPGDPAMVARGKAIYDINCALCHGEDARGGDNGPNLIRGEVVMNDQNSELIGPVLQNGRVAEGMPKFTFTAAQVSDIAAFLHSFRVGGYDISRNRPPSIVVGDAKAGAAYFNSKCGSCHSVTGDLKGIGGRITDARALQQRWLMPTGGGGRGGGQQGAPTTVTVTMPSGEKLEGRLGRIDDFTVTVIDTEGGSRTIARDGAVPKVEIHDPLEPHKQMLKVYTDKDIHDVTAYMVTLK